MGLFSGLFDFSNFSFKDALLDPIVKPMEGTKKAFENIAEGDFKGLFSDNQAISTEALGNIGINEDSKIAQNSDAIAATIVGGIFAAPALAGAAGAGGAGAAAGGAGAGGMGSLGASAIGGSSLGTAATGGSAMNALGASSIASGAGGMGALGKSAVAGSSLSGTGAAGGGLLSTGMDYLGKGKDYYDMAQQANSMYKQATGADKKREIEMRRLGQGARNRSLVVNSGGGKGKYTLKGGLLQ